MIESRIIGLVLFVSGIILISSFNHWTTGIAVWLMIWGNKFREIE